MDLKELENGVDPDTHWYYQSKKLPLRAFVRDVFLRTRKPLTLIDVGSGSGFFMYDLEDAVPEMISRIVLVDTGYSDSEIQASRGQHIEKTRELPQRIENAIVVMMDVLEHLEDDGAMLRSIKAKAVGENYYFVTVPAFAALWSGHDDYLGHYRRYTRKTLRSVLEASGYAVTAHYYFFGLIFPLVWVVRKLAPKKPVAQSDMQPAGRVANMLLMAACRMEAAIRKLNTVAGVTCVSEGRFASRPATALSPELA